MVYHDSLLTIDLVLYVVIIISFEESELLGCAQVDMIDQHVLLDYSSFPFVPLVIVSNHLNSFFLV